MLKPIFIVTLALCLVGGGLFFYQESSNETDTNQASSAQSGQKLLAKLDTKALSQIKINTDAREIKLIQKQGGGWKEQSTDYEVNVEKIQDILLKMTQIHLGDLITNKPENHKRFQLQIPNQNPTEWKNEENGIGLSLLRGDESPIISLQFGKQRSQGDGQYIRYGDSNKVFLIPESMDIETEMSEWLDKKLLALNADEIQALSFQEGEETVFSIIRDNASSSWIPKEIQFPFLPEKQKLEQLLKRLGNLSFSKLIQDPEFAKSENDAEQEMSLTVFMSDQSIYTLKLQPSENNGDMNLSLRMGISMSEEQGNDHKRKKLQNSMESFNQKIKGRLYQIQSWEAQELILKDEKPEQ